VPAERLSTVSNPFLVFYLTWKQSQCIFIIISDFNQNMTRKLLDEIIMKVEALGFRIHGITFDLGNKTFLSQVGFNAGNYFIPNPIDPENRKIYLFPGNGLNTLSA
jgi:hypothetical protein